jgi:hypothetical protein
MLVPMLGAMMITGILAGYTRAAEPAFEQVLPAKMTTALLEHRSKVLRGLNGGGIIVWDRVDPLATERWTSGKDLSGNYITDMTWTGQHVWIATRGAGLTRVTDLDTAPEFRQYINNLGSLDVTAVTGTVIGDGERVFYGMDGKGLGQINSGLSGNIYTAEQDGLISNDVITLQMFQDDLFVGTPIGISRFANNVFTDQNAGLTNLVINDLTLDSDGNLLAASNAGIHQWDPDGQTWLLLGTIGPRVVDITSSAGLVYALGLNPNGSGVLSEYDGDTWSTIALPYPECSAIDAGEEFWIGGPVKNSTPGGTLTFNYLGRRLTGDDFDTVVGIATQVSNCEGVAFGADGAAWMGDWHGLQISSYDARDNSSFFIYERSHAANDTLNLFPGLGPVLSIVGDPDGTVYAGQYAGGGVLKFNPATGTTDLMGPDNSGLQGRSVVNLVVHPDGPLIIVHDVWDTQRVEVLVEPGNWTSTASWVVPPMDQGLDSGSSVWDALVEKRDIIWFAVEDGGLVRWDINGPDAGPNDPLTWFDQSDDVWYDPVAFFTSTSLDPGKTVGLALGRDGSLWAGGNGLVQFTYEIGAGTHITTTVKLDFQEKISASTNGLVNGNVKDIAVDANGDVWVATRTGLNRVSPRGDEALIAAWIDLPNYLANPNYGVLYSPNVIAPLPGNTYAKIVPSLDGRRMLLSSDQGTTLITVGAGPGSSGGTDPLKAVYCYPNPWTPGELGGRLKIGGLPVETVRVDIHNLEGQRVFSDKSVAEGIGFWEGDTIRGNPVTSGMYILKITSGGLTTTRILAVVR